MFQSKTKPTLLNPDELVLHIYDNKISISHICNYAGQSTLFFHNKLKAKDKPKELKDLDKPFYYSQRLTPDEIKLYKHNTITLAMFPETTQFLLRILRSELPLTYQGHLSKMCDYFYTQLSSQVVDNGVYTFEQLEELGRESQLHDKKWFKEKLKHKDDPRVKLELVEYIYKSQGHNRLLNPVRSEKEKSKRLELQVEGYAGNIAITKADIQCFPDLKDYLFEKDMAWLDEKPPLASGWSNMASYKTEDNEVEPTDEELEWTQGEQREVKEREREANLPDEDDRDDKWLNRFWDKPVKDPFIEQQQEQTAKRRLYQGNRSSIISELITQETELIDKLNLQISDINDKLSSLNDELSVLELERQTTQKKIEALQTVQNLYN